jgi:hypothetical protein
MRLRTALVGLCIVALPAAAQQLAPASSGDRVTASGRLGWQAAASPAAHVSPWEAGTFVVPRSGQGFSLDRAGTLDPGLRANADMLQLTPLAPRPLASGSEPAPADAGVYLGYRYSNWTFSSAVRQSLDDPRVGAARLDLGASYGYSLTPRHLITLSGGLTLGQPGTALRPYSALGGDALSQRTLRYGEPGAGFRVSWLYTLDRNLYVNTTLGYDRLYADPAEGFGTDRGTATFGTVFGYRFY